MIDWNEPQGPDKLRAVMAKERLKTWGLAVVRCSYSSEEDWELFLSIIKERVQSNLESCNSLDLWHHVAVIEDKARLENAEVDRSSNIFTEWAQQHVLE